MQGCCGYFVFSIRQGLCAFNCICNNCYFTETQTAKIEFLNISCTGIQTVDVDFISYHVLKFSRLKVLDISSNLSLDSEAVNRMVATFAGKSIRQTYARSEHIWFVLIFFICFEPISLVRKRRWRQFAQSQSKRYQHRKVAR